MNVLRQAQDRQAQDEAVSRETVYMRKLAKALDRGGSLYILQDILDAIAEGRMQSFVARDSWAITQVHAFPRAKALEIIAVVGDLGDGEALHDQVVAFAEDTGCGLIMAHGRLGWLKRAQAHGWKVLSKSMVFAKEL
jgi:hypothetical protein